MEVYQNGDMHNFLCPDDVSLNKYDPLHCKWLAAEMIKAVKFLHDNNLAHRDIKLDNFILSNEFKPMLIDFGQVEEYDGQLCEQPVGTEGFMAPEISRYEPYDALKTDSYSLAQCMFLLHQGEWALGAREDGWGLDAWDQ